mgnify:CR=1 FL=1
MDTTWAVRSRSAYRAVYKGRMNKKGRPVKDLEIDRARAKLSGKYFLR